MMCEGAIITSKEMEEYTNEDMDVGQISCGNWLSTYNSSVYGTMASILMLNNVLYE